MRAPRYQYCIIWWQCYHSNVVYYLSVIREHGVGSCKRSQLIIKKREKTWCHSFIHTVKMRRRDNTLTYKVALVGHLVGNEKYMFFPCSTVRQETFVFSFKDFPNPIMTFYVLKSKYRYKDVLWRVQLVFFFKLQNINQTWVTLKRPHTAIDSFFFFAATNCFSSFISGEIYTGS